MISYIVSDCDAVKIMFDSYGYTKTPEDAVVDVLKAGMVGSHFLFSYQTLETNIVLYFY